MAAKGTDHAGKEDCWITGWGYTGMIIQHLCLQLNSSFRITSSPIPALVHTSTPLKLTALILMLIQETEYIFVDIFIMKSSIYIYLSIYYFIFTLMSFRQMFQKTRRKHTKIVSLNVHWKLSMYFPDFWTFELPEILQEAKINVYTNSFCDGKWPGNVNDGHICIGDSVNKKTSCNVRKAFLNISKLIFCLIVIVHYEFIAHYSYFIGNIFWIYLLGFYSMAKA